MARAAVHKTTSAQTLGMIKQNIRAISTQFAIIVATTFSFIIPWVVKNAILHKHPQQPIGCICIVQGSYICHAIPSHMHVYNDMQ